MLEKIWIVGPFGRLESAFKVSFLKIATKAPGHDLRPSILFFFVTSC
jgi:hypothetical protein